MTLVDAPLRRIAVLVLVGLTVAGYAFGGGAAEPVAAATDDTIDVTLWRTIDRFTPEERYRVVPYDTHYGVLEEKFNVRFQFTDIAQAAANEMLNIMVATNDLPDLVYSWSHMDKSFLDPALLYADRQIYSLDEFSEHIPDYLAVLDEYPAIRKNVTSDDGHLLYFAEPNIYLESAFSGGPMLRKDWLDKLGLDIPDTYEEWLTVFEAFKTQDPNETGQDDTIPYVGAWGTLRVLANTLGVTNEFQMEGGPNGRVVYGPLLPGYRERLLFMREVVENGYINSDYMSFTGAVRDEAAARGIMGATFTGIGQMDRWNLSMEQSGLYPDHLIWAVAYPRGLDGNRHFDRAMITKSATDAAFMIARSAPEPARIAQIANYFYTEEGKLLTTFGVEGITYEMIDGFPVYTDLIMRNPEGLTPFDARAKYVGIAGTPKPVDIRDVAQLSLSTPASRAAVMSIWTDVFEIEQNMPIPPVLMGDEDAQEFADIMADLQTYVDTESSRMVEGLASIENDFDNFQATVRRMGAERAMELMQRAVEQWQQRGGPYEYNMARADIDWSNLPMMSDQGSELVDPSMISPLRE